MRDGDPLELRQVPEVSPSVFPRLESLSLCGGYPNRFECICHLRSALCVFAQVSLHTCPRALLRELAHVFPEVDLTSCLAVPTNQKAVVDLVSIGDPVENEKDNLLHSVSLSARQVLRCCRQYCKTWGLRSVFIIRTRLPCSRHACRCTCAV